MKKKFDTKKNEIDNDNMNNNANLLKEKIKSSPKDKSDNNVIQEEKKINNNSNNI